MHFISLEIKFTFVAVFVVINDCNMPVINLVVSIRIIMVIARNNAL